MANKQLTFEEMVNQRLPAHMLQLWERMKRPVSMSLFAEDGVGKKTAFKKLQKEGLCSVREFPGAYVLVDNGTPIYVGISRNVISRLLQHVKGTTHFSASLAYRIASGTSGSDTGTRSEKMDDPSFKKHFEEAQKNITGYEVAFIEIDNAVELYLFEVYAAMKLGTSAMNSFRTH